MNRNSFDEAIEAWRGENNPDKGAVAAQVLASVFGVCMSVYTAYKEHNERAFNEYIIMEQPHCSINRIMAEVDDVIAFSVSQQCAKVTSEVLIGTYENDMTSLSQDRVDRIIETAIMVTANKNNCRPKAISDVIRRGREDTGAKWRQYIKEDKSG